MLSLCLHSVKIYTDGFSFLTSKTTYRNLGALRPVGEKEREEDRIGGRGKGEGREGGEGKYQKGKQLRKI